MSNKGISVSLNIMDRFHWAGDKVAFVRSFDIKKTMRTHLTILVLLILASVVQILYYYP